jgi:hypothetical protein
MATKKATKTPQAPGYLSPRASQLWAEILADYDLAPAEVELLRQACSALDRAESAAQVLDRDGLTTIDRYGATRAHPLVDVELRNRALFARLLAQLRVEATPANPVRRGRPAAGSTGRDPRLRVEVPERPLSGARARVRLTGGDL